MSGFVSEPVRTDEQVEHATSKDGASVPYADQRHDRSRNIDERDNDTVTINDEDNREHEVDISASQKMLSAVSGSLLTSLLVTPLDVVRVRLQSQSSGPKPNLAPSTFPRNLSTFTNLPPNLGVTACCREVFWVNNTSPFCIASASPASSATYTALNPSLSPISSSSATADCAVDETRRKTFTSTLDGLRKIARNEGPTSLWRGLSPTLVMAIPANVIYFTGYDSLRSHPHSPIKTHVPDAYAPLIAGSMARIAAATTISPIEMFRTRMQAATSSNSGTGVFMETLGGLKKMVQSQGYTSLWRGLTLTMWRDVPFSGIYWWGYEAMRNTLTDLREPTHLRVSERPRDHAHAFTFVDSFIAGAASGAVASVVTTPFDVGKTRQQVLEHSPNSGRATTSSSSTSGGKELLRPEERSMPRFIYHIWQQEGTAGLFRGWVARTLKVAPACAIMISSYEVGKKMARGVNERKRLEEVG
ncbi:MAG: hypothetical protein Q9164_001151 [Protoblastenia rupestris]